VALKQWRESGTEQRISPQVLREYMALRTRPHTLDDAENERLWLEEYQTMINASEQVFSMLDAEESQEKQWDHPQ
jgi:hypothetical protein